MADTDADAVRRLRSLKHIVVVMMENRSFDHMLGYLPREGMDDVDGLKGTEYNLGPDKKKRFVHAFDTEANKVLRPGEALQKKFDPDHSVAAVKKQLGKGYGDFTNGGFVQSFFDSRKKADNIKDNDLDVPMGYYTSKDVPVYDHLARQYCVCDRWFASVPGDTWPNRMYALTGQEGSNVSENNGLWDVITDLPPLRRLKKVPLFDVPAFTRHLEPRDWRWYSHDPGTLRVVDGAYRDLANPMADNFAFFDKRKVDGLTRILERPIVGGAAFLDDAARNKLPKVSWIDPNFVDLSVRETISNDDHPPSDIRAGQAFVYDVYNTLRQTKDWDDTLLVVTYDEHGGFYDHFMPPPLSASDEPKRYATYGLRVPALIAGPRVMRKVLHEPARVEDGRPDREQPQWDHTAIIKTILLSCLPQAKADAAIKKMPGRVRRAPHLGQVLLDAARRDVDSARNEGNLMEAWREEARRRREVQPEDVAVAEAAGIAPRAKAPDGAGQPVVLTDFQIAWHMVATALKKAGIDA